MSTNQEIFRISVEAIGPFSRTLRAACFWACREVRLVPKQIIRINTRNAIVIPYEDTGSTELFVRIMPGASPKNFKEAMLWSYDPTFFQRNWRSKAHTTIKRMLATLDVPTRKYVFVAPESEIY